MKKVMVSLFIFVGLIGAAVPPLIIPYILDSATTPQVRYIDFNNNAIQSTVNTIVDTLNNLQDFASAGAKDSAAVVYNDSSRSGGGKPIFSAVTADTIQLNDALIINCGNCKVLKTNGSGLVGSAATVGAGTKVPVISGIAGMTDTLATTDFVRANGSGGGADSLVITSTNGFGGVLNTPGDSYTRGNSLCLPDSSYCSYTGGLAARQWFSLNNISKGGTLVSDSEQINRIYNLRITDTSQSSWLVGTNDMRSNQSRSDFTNPVSAGIAKMLIPDTCKISNADTSKVKYFGTWTSGNPSNFHSNTANDSITFNASGTSIVIGTYSLISAGFFNVFVDGVAKGTATCFREATNPYSVDRAYSARIVTGLSNATHHLKLVVASNAYCFFTFYYGNGGVVMKYPKLFLSGTIALPIPGYTIGGAFSHGTPAIVTAYNQYLDSLTTLYQTIGALVRVHIYLDTVLGTHDFLSDSLHPSITGTRKISDSIAAAFTLSNLKRTIADSKQYLPYTISHASGSNGSVFTTPVIAPTLTGAASVNGRLRGFAAVNPNTGTGAFAEASIGADSTGHELDFNYLGPAYPYSGFGLGPNGALVYTNNTVTGGLNLRTDALASIGFYHSTSLPKAMVWRFDGTLDVGDTISYPGKINVIGGYINVGNNINAGNRGLISLNPNTGTSAFSGISVGEDTTGGHSLDMNWLGSAYTYSGFGLGPRSALHYCSQCTGGMNFRNDAASPIAIYRSNHPLYYASTSNNVSIGDTTDHAVKLYVTGKIKTPDTLIGATVVDGDVAGSFLLKSGVNGALQNQTQLVGSGSSVMLASSVTGSGTIGVLATGPTLSDVTLTGKTTTSNVATTGDDSLIGLGGGTLYFKMTSTNPSARNIGFFPSLSSYGTLDLMMGLSQGSDASAGLSVMHVGMTGALSFGAHVGYSGTIPTIGSCGTSAAITTGSTDNSGEVTEGTLATGCTITFATVYTTKPLCTVTQQSGLAASYTVSTSAITVTNIGALSSTTMNYMCSGN